MLILGLEQQDLPDPAGVRQLRRPGLDRSRWSTRLPEAERAGAARRAARCKNTALRHMVGEFTSRALMERLQPQNYPTVMVLGDAIGGGRRRGVGHARDHRAAPLARLPPARRRRRAGGVQRDPRPEESRARRDHRDPRHRDIERDGEHGARADHLRAAHPPGARGPLRSRRAARSTSRTSRSTRRPASRRRSST